MTKIIDSFVKIDNVTLEFQINGVVHTISLEDFEEHYLQEVIEHVGLKEVLQGGENITKDFLLETLIDNDFDIESNIEYLLEFGYHQEQDERATLNETMFTQGQLDVFEKKTKKGRKVYLCYRNGSDWLYQIVRITYSEKRQKVKVLAKHQTNFLSVGFTEIPSYEYDKVKNILNNCLTDNGSHYIAETLNSYFKQEFFKDK